MTKGSAFAIVAAVTLVASVMALPRQARADRAATASVPISSAQVAAGGKAFEVSCSGCHGAALEGGAGPALTGPNFKILSSKVHATVGDVFGYMSSAMPMNAPGTLKKDQYLAIMAFVLSKNGYKPGPAPLTLSVANSSKAPVDKN